VACVALAATLIVPESTSAGGPWSGSSQALYHSRINRQRSSPPTPGLNAMTNVPSHPHVAPLRPWWVPVSVQVAKLSVMDFTENGTGAVVVIATVVEVETAVESVTAVDDSSRESARTFVSDRPHAAATHQSDRDEGKSARMAAHCAIRSLYPHELSYPKTAITIVAIGYCQHCAISCPPQERDP